MAPTMRHMDPKAADNNNHHARSSHRWAHCDEAVAEPSIIRETSPAPHAHHMVIRSPELPHNPTHLHYRRPLTTAMRPRPPIRHLPPPAHQHPARLPSQEPLRQGSGLLCMSGSRPSNPAISPGLQEGQAAIFSSEVIGGIRRSMVITDRLQKGLDFTENCCF